MPLAVGSSTLVFSMVSFAWSGLSAAFGPALLLTLWWKRCTGNGVLAGMIGGTVSVLLWRVLGGNDLVSSGRAGVGAWLGIVLATAVKLTLVFLMIGIFVFGYGAAQWLPGS